MSSADTAIDDGEFESAAFDGGALDDAPDGAAENAPDEGPGPIFQPSTNPVAASWSLFIGIALVMVGNGLLSSLLGIRSELEGFPAVVSGAIMAAYFAGFLVGGRVAIRAMTLVGHIRVFAALASMASAASLVHALTVHPLSWWIVRFTTGLCMAGLYVVAESWINDLATNANRGRLLAIYMVVSMGGMGGGQLLLNAGDPGGSDLFLLASVLVSLSLVPVVLSVRATPPTRAAEPMSLRSLLRVVQSGPIASLLVGLAHGAMTGMGAFYATRAGMSPARVALFMAAPMAGGVVLQWPIGTLSDRLPRRAVMVAVATAASLVAAGLLVIEEGSALAMLSMFALGGLSFPLYSLAIAYTHDWIRPEQAMGASAALVTMNGIGATMGPLLAAATILAFGNRTFFLALALAHGVIAAFLIYRSVVGSALPRSRQGPFVAVPARASAIALMGLVRRLPPTPVREARRRANGGQPNR